MAQEKLERPKAAHENQHVEKMAESYFVIRIRTQQQPCRAEQKGIQGTPGPRNQAIPPRAGENPIALSRYEMLSAET